MCFVRTSRLPPKRRVLKFYKIRYGRNFYHPNQPSTRCVLLINCTSRSRCHRPDALTSLKKRSELIVSIIRFIFCPIFFLESLYLRICEMFFLSIFLYVKRNGILKFFKRKQRSSSGSME